MARFREQLVLQVVAGEVLQFRVSIFGGLTNLGLYVSDALGALFNNTRI
jgi:hypothetical protein